MHIYIYMYIPVNNLIQLFLSQSSFARLKCKSSSYDRTYLSCAKFECHIIKLTTRDKPCHRSRGMIDINLRWSRRSRKKMKEKEEEEGGVAPQLESCNRTWLESYYEFCVWQLGRCCNVIHTSTWCSRVRCVRLLLYPVTRNERTPEITCNEISVVGKIRILIIDSMILTYVR